MGRALKPKDLSEGLGPALKPSRYSLLIPGRRDGEWILYHSATGALGLVDATVAAYFQGMGSSDALADDALRSSLQAAGFLVAMTEDEVAQQERLYREAQQNPSVFTLCLAPTYGCNLACPYCYESGHDAANTIMDQEMQAEVINFVERFYAARPFERLEVQWYGGEPLLAPEVIESVASQLLDFCHTHGIAYASNMVSNATLIGPAEAALLKKAQVQEVLVTVDGPSAIHNVRRPQRSMGDSFEAVMEGIAHLQQAGIAVGLQMNVDKANEAQFEALNAAMENRFGLSVMAVKLNDYYQTFGQGKFCTPTFDLMNHEEFARRQAQRFCGQPHDLREFEALMRPPALFCRGQQENYFAIDALGDVYKCDGEMGRTQHRLGNVHTWNQEGWLPSDTAPRHPFDDEECRNCALLPLCKGTCRWERFCCDDHPCHPFKHTIGDYLRAWVNSMGEEGVQVEGFRLLGRIMVASVDDADYEALSS